MHRTLLEGATAMLWMRYMHEAAAIGSLAHVSEAAQPPLFSSLSRTMVIVARRWEERWLVPESRAMDETGHSFRGFGRFPDRLTAPPVCWRGKFWGKNGRWPLEEWKAAHILIALFCNVDTFLCL